MNRHKWHAKPGWLKVGGRLVWFRSTLEMWWARRLQFWKDAGLISDWNYEDRQRCRFDFFGPAIPRDMKPVLRGNNSVLLDFVVDTPDGAEVFYECKGCMTPESKTKLRRMKKYYPDKHVVLVVRNRRQHVELAQELGYGLIEVK